MYKFNKYQTPLTEELLNSLNPEVKEWLLEAITTIPFIRNLISPDRKRAKDLPRDERGRIIVDLVNPHILEDMDYFTEVRRHYETHGCYTFLKPNSSKNSAFYKFWEREIERCLDGMVRESDGEWVTGDLYYQLNYCPMQVNVVREGTNLADRMEGFASVWEGLYWRMHYLYQARNGGKYNNFDGGNHCAELARRGAGKAHPYSSNVLTTKGINKWKDVHIGDYLYSQDGRPTKVIDIPYDEETDIYKITLYDNRVIYCTENHLFNVLYKGNVCTRPLKDIMKSYRVNRTLSDKCTKPYEYVYRIPTNNCLEFSSTQTSIDPYTFGILLGDGCFRNTKHKNVYYFTATDNDALEYMRHIPYGVTKLKGKYLYKIGINTESLGNLWILTSKEKYIPEEYLFTSKDNRLSLLKGLMDAGGTVEKGTPVFSTSSKDMRDTFVFLCRSLGFNVTESPKVPKINGKEYSTSYIIRVYTGGETIFNLSRKASLQRNTKSNLSKYKGTTIVNIEYSHKERAKCVTVDSIDGTYLIDDFVVTHNSYSLASLMAKRLLLGESLRVRKKVITVLSAYLKEFLAEKDGTLSKFKPMIDHCAITTHFPRLKLQDSMSNQMWQMGYKDAETNANMGSLNAVMGISVKENEGKIRGKRGHIYFEEFGTFPNLLSVYNNVRPSVEEGDKVFALIYLIGTAGDKESDFSSAQELMYHPKGYNIYALPNVYDKEGEGKGFFSFFFPGYVNRSGCYNKDGVSDVIKALIEIYQARLKAKYDTSDTNTVVKLTAEIPVTPKEAILKVKNNIFPVSDILERLMQIDGNPRFYDESYTGELLLSSGNVEFKPRNILPIRDFPLKGNNHEGALEIFAMPEKDSSNRAMPNRYIIGVDPYENDQADSLSLGSILVLDLFSDTLVAEYTGRPPYADDFYEEVRKLSIFYNAKVLYENNKKGMYAYFQKMNSLYMLADTPEYLKDIQVLKAQSIGNSSKGVAATVPVNDYARMRIRDWLLKPVTFVENNGEEDISSTIYNLYFIKNRALLKELAVWNPQGNYDRVSALGMVMLYREEYMIKYQGDVKSRSVKPNNSLALDPFFTKNFRPIKNSN